MALALLAALAARASAETPRGTWPPFLEPPETFPTDVVAAVERVWIDPTISRTVKGRTAHVPFDLYVVFIDTPEVTAAAARYRKLARYEVQVLGDDRYRAEDHEGARGLYRVLVRETNRRVVLSWGEHSGSILGTIRGSALTVLDLAPRAGAVDQGLTAYVRIDNAVAAALARLFILIFGSIADQKLAEGFSVTARVAEWANEQPGEFCEWLGREPLAPERRERLLGVLPGCRSLTSDR